MQVELARALEDLQQGRQRAAETAMRRVLDQTPGYAAGMEVLAMALAGQGQVEEARSWFSRAADLQPGSLSAWMNLGNVCLESADAQAAGAAFERARALGADVASMGLKEIGFAPLTLTAQGRASPLAALAQAPVLHWHGDRFEIPEGATLLAGTALCMNQAFSVGEHVLALQFHIEALPQQIEHWLVGHACELAQAGIDPIALRRQAQAAALSLPAAARAVFGAWLDALPADSGVEHSTEQLKHRSNCHV